MEFTKVWLKLVRIKSELCLIILIGMSVLWTAFDEFDCPIYFDICFLSTVENEKLIALLLLHTFPILSMPDVFYIFI